MSDLRRLTVADLTEATDLNVTILGSLVTHAIALTRLNPTRQNAEALAALGEAQARVRFAAAVFASQVPE